MLDVEKLEAAGFEKTMTTEEWEAYNESEQEQYFRPTGGDQIELAPTGVVTKNYVLKRNHVLLVTEQNTQSSTASGIPARIEYPEIVIIRSEKDPRQVACDASDTELILALVAEFEQSPAKVARSRRAD